MITIKKEPKISVGILTEKKINFELYGEFKVEGLTQILSGRFSAEIIKDTIVCKRERKYLNFKMKFYLSP